MDKPQNKREVYIPDFQTIVRGVKQYITDLIRLDKGVDKKATIEEIKNKKSMSEANAWMLMCSIVIASIGLSQNSQAVIIGAMLISPLMSPILGIGLGVGINDHNTLIKSLKHLLLAIMITLVTSTIYFYFTPFGEFTDEIRARTEPTFLDIFIAIFGGIAGIVSIARKDISTTLPGVAIATALMPPLCVTGYGIANADWDVALTSFYLFFLNTFFVALSTYLIIKFLNFPLRKYMNPEDKKRNLYAVIVISLAAVIPSFFIFKNVLEDLNKKSRLQTFISEHIGENLPYLDAYKIIEGDTSDILYLTVYGNKINESKIPEYNAALEKLKIYNTKVEIIPTSEVDLSDIASIENKLLSLEHMTQRLDETKKVKQDQDNLILQLSQQINGAVIDSNLFINVAAELRTIFPKIKEIGIAKIQKTDFESYEKELPIAFIVWENSTGRNERKSNETKLQNFLQERLDLDSIIILKH